jgi:hypothetical protein
MKIERAIKRKQKLRLGIMGAAGSGKTYSSLLLACELGEKVCIIDTEAGSASLYADQFKEYDTISLGAPFEPKRYIEAMKLIENSGYDVIVIDSLTHEWSGVGGCLDMVSNITKSSNSGNSYTAWNKITPEHNKLIETILNSKCHVIATLRAKTAYDMIQVNGKMRPQKVGVEAVQREGMEYEFTTLFSLDQNHNFICSKDRTKMFDNPDVPEAFTSEIALKLLEWLNQGEDKPIDLFEGFREKALELYEEINNGIISKEVGAEKWEELRSGALRDAVPVSPRMDDKFTELLKIGE